MEKIQHCYTVYMEKSIQLAEKDSEDQEKICNICSAKNSLLYQNKRWTKFRLSTATKSAGWFLLCHWHWYLNALLDLLLNLASADNSESLYIMAKQL